MEQKVLVCNMNRFDRSAQETKKIRGASENGHSPSTVFNVNNSTDEARYPPLDVNHKIRFTTVRIFSNPIPFLLYLFLNSILQEYSYLMDI